MKLNKIYETLSATQFAKAVDLHFHTVARLIKAGEIRAEKAIGRVGKYSIPAGELLKFVVR